ncbi:hypothetical protein SNE40_015589 [Patella caerulea]|uniref:Phorbol-ester/DAG-type domain-containing protein n=1 Tax=Patella caerulea TaxID=87958 RepID=A0AAN8JK79_PATCE
MARQFLEHIYVSETGKVMARSSPMSTGNYCESTPSPDVFGLIKRKLVRVQANIEQNCKNVFQAVQGIGQQTPVKRRLGNRNSNNNVNDHDLSLPWPCQEHIEMAQFFGQGSGKGHHYLPCQLYNPTWCDYCGDFIWGISKQCVKCTSK